MAKQGDEPLAKKGRAKKSNQSELTRVKQELHRD